MASLDAVVDYLSHVDWLFQELDEPMEWLAILSIPVFTAVVGWPETAGSVTPSACAAALTVPSRATVRNVRSWERVN